LTDNANVWQPNEANDAEDFEETASAVKVGCTFGELQKIELPERVEIVRGLGRGENGLLNAVSNTGKSTLIRNLALSLVLDKPFEPLTSGGKRYRVAIIDSEDTVTFLRSDLNKMQADFTDAEKKLIEENLFLICELSFGDEDLKLNKPEHFERVVNAINDFGADFVVIDTVTSAFAIRNENDNSEVIKYVMNPLKRLARLTDAGVLTAHHIGKAKLENGETKEGVHRGRGASAFADKSRTIFNLDKDGDDRIILSCPKLKGEKFPDTIFKYDKDRRLFERKGETHIVSNYEILLDAFEDDKGYKRKDIDEILEGEMSKATITRNLKEAVGCGDLYKQKGVYSKKCSNAHTL
jgi:archaellum biogenesis ATPase FlaH